MKTIYVAHIEQNTDPLVHCILHVSDLSSMRIVHTCVSKKIADHLKIGDVFLCRTDEIVAEIGSKLFGHKTII